MCWRGGFPLCPLPPAPSLGGPGVALCPGRAASWKETALQPRRGCGPVSCCCLRPLYLAPHSGHCGLRALFCSPQPDPGLGVCGPPAGVGAVGPSGCPLCAGCPRGVGAVSLGRQGPRCRPGPASPCRNPAGLSSPSPALHRWVTLVRLSVLRELSQWSGGQVTGIPEGTQSHQEENCFERRWGHCRRTSCPRCPVGVPSGPSAPAPAFPRGSRPWPPAPAGWVASPPAPGSASYQGSSGRR